MLTEILHTGIRRPLKHKWLSVLTQTNASKQTPSFSFDFWKLKSAVKGVLQHQSNSLCFPQNLKLRFHIHSPKLHMHKSMDKSRCKLGYLNWMVKQTNKTDVNMSSSQRRWLCTASSSSAFSLCLETQLLPQSSSQHPSTFWSVFKLGCFLPAM